MFRFVLLWVSVVFLLASCGKASDAAAPSVHGAQGTNQKVFQARGVIQSIKPAHKEIEIKHEEIPGYMPAMTMPFDVRDTNELIGLQPGQTISFRLLVTDTDGWIDQIKPVAAKPDVVSTVSTSTPPIRVVEPLELHEPLPQYRFTNQLGQTISTTQFKGDALAITFLFTRCPFPTFCPRLANDFEQAQQKLLTLQGGPTNWHLLTISFDPDFDLPEVLKAYAEAHHYDPAHSTFATGDLADVSALGDLFGLAFWRDSNGGITHNMRAAVIDANGRLQRVFEGKDWTSAELVAEMVKAAKPESR
jgi:protein SCO1/2